jgi:galactokinase
MAWDVFIASPGRINLIGEHTDYNDGFVLPAAINKHIFLKLRRNGTESKCTINSEGFENTFFTDLYDMKPGTEGWHDYVLGVLEELLSITQSLKGFDCSITTEVPVGSGMSSSAALECGIAFGLNQLFDLELDKMQLILLCQRAEHKYVGTQCGIMDQFASMMGKESHSILLDCNSLEYEFIPTNLDPYVILMLNTNVTHNLASSEYNKRREESASGLKIISEHFGVDNSFRSINMDMVDECADLLGDVRYRRCSYVLEENKRVLDAAAALKRGDIDFLGKLLYESHLGQQFKYEVSCQELDFLVDMAKMEQGILGARMMGGGFGGCTLNIIHKDQVSRFFKKVSNAYYTKFGIALSHFITSPSQGTKLI